ncbi:amidase [Marinactinospora endophytica]
MAEIHDLSAIEQAAAVRRRELSPVEIADHYLDRIGRHGTTVGAFITVTRELAEQQARNAEKRVLTEPVEDLPPLLGVPVPIKDLDMLAGQPWTSGTNTHSAVIATEDEAFVAELRRAGAIFTGKTNTPEFGLSCYTENDIAPAARTPWDLSRSAGGSSGGAAAAVAAGLAPMAQGSDGGGSIRVPASVCGLFGLKPSRGRVTNAPRRPDLIGLSATGPLSRTVADAALMLDVISVSRPGDYYALPPLGGGRTFLELAGREPGRLRIARFARPPVADAVVHPDVLAAYEEATRLLLRLGHEVEEIPVPFDPGMLDLFGTVWAVMAGRAVVAAEREARLRPLTRWLRERAARTTAAQYLDATAGLQQAARAALPRMAPYDAVLTPTLAEPPAPVGRFTDLDDPAAEFREMTLYTPFGTVYNITGQPAVNLPLHWNTEGLPIGVMLAGRIGDEATLLSLSAQLEAARPWADRRPPIWSS